MYKQLKIKNFRCFRKLNFDKLARINLIAGKNNVGKTALLEAIFLHGGAYNPELAFRINAFRGMESFKVEYGTKVEAPWNSLFYQFNTREEIQIEGKDTNLDFLTVKLKEIIASEEFEKIFRFPEYRPLPTTLETLKVLKLIYEKNGEKGEYYLVIDPNGIRVLPFPPPPPFPTVFLGARMRIPFREEAERFGKLETYKKEELLINALKIIEPRLKRITLVVIGMEPILHGDIGMDRLVPLPLIGEGFHRLAGLVISIANASGGVVLIDEIENGLHYSVLKNVWKVIDKVSRKFKVQIFATTHSLECIAAAYEAFSEYEEEEFRFHRLEKDEGDTIDVITYDREALEGALEMGLEVR